MRTAEEHRAEQGRNGHLERLAKGMFFETVDRRAISRAPNLRGHGALVVVPNGYFNLRTESGLIADKVEHILRELRTSSIPSVLVATPRPSERPFPIAGTCHTMERAEFIEAAKERLRRASRRHEGRMKWLASWEKSDSIEDGNMWKAILSRINPAAVVGINLASGLCAEARARGIPAVEVQHGMLGEWLSALYADRLSSGKPTHMLTWDRPTNGRVRDCGIEPLATGYPDLRAPNSLSGRRLRDPADQHRPEILVAASRTVREAADPFGTISPSLHDALEAILKVRADVRVRFRLHPIYEYDPAPLTEWLQQTYSGCQVSLASRTYILDELANADLLLTRHSSAIFEAALVGTPSIVLADGYTLTKESVDDSPARTQHFSGMHHDLPVAAEESGLIRRVTSSDAVPAAVLAATSRSFAPYAPEIDLPLTDALAQLGCVGRFH